MNLRVLIASVVALLTAACAAWILPGAASAHDTIVTGVASCQADGTYTVTWKIENDWDTSAAVTKVSNTGGGTLTGLPATLPGSPGRAQPYQYITATQTGIPGNAGSASLQVKAVWSDYNATETGTVTLPGVCTPVSPTAPTFTPAACTGPGTSGTASYTIPATTGVKYYVNGSATAKAAGTYPLSNGSTVTVTAAVAASNYVLIDYPAGGWSFTATAPGCIVDAPPTAPTFTADACTDQYTNAGASYTIPAITGVDYYVNGVKTGAGTYPVAAGTVVTVTAVAQPGYALTGYPQGGWSHTFPAAPDCTQHVTPATPGFTAIACTGPGTSASATYTIPARAGVTYQVDGVTVAPGTYDLTTGATVTITAAAQPTYSLDGTTEWSFTATPKGCIITATPAVPTFAAQQCDDSYRRTDATVTIPATTGVSYQVDGVTVAAGTTAIVPGTHTVTATALDGYVLAADYPATGWSYTVTVVPCEFAVLASPPQPPALASTGSPDRTLALLAGGVLFAGAGLLLISRRLVRR